MGKKNATISEECSQWDELSVEQTDRHKKTNEIYSSRSFSEEEENEKIKRLVEALCRRFAKDPSFQYQMREFIGQRVETFLAEDMYTWLKDVIREELNRLSGNRTRQIRIGQLNDFESTIIDEEEDASLSTDIPNQSSLIPLNVTPIEVTFILKPEVPEFTVDYSDTKASEKIVFLHQLGIINYLRTKSPFNASTNKLAEVISAFTGIPQTTAQSYINPIISKDVIGKNNPLKEKCMTIVKQKLTNMGYQE